MVQLNQILALSKGQRARAEKGLTEAYHTIQKLDALVGITRQYQPRDDTGEQLPGESKKIQTTVERELARALPDLKRSYDLAFTLDVANTHAAADIVVGDQTLLQGVPVTHLMPLEKRLVDLRTVIAKLPVLDPAETWEYDENTEAYRSEPVKTTRGKKVPRNHEKAPATDKHPAQVEVYFEDVIVGDWTTTKFCGAITAQRKSELTKRIDDLIAAVASAREKANSMEVQDEKAGEALLGWLFA